MFLTIKEVYVLYRSQCFLTIKEVYVLYRSQCFLTIKEVYVLYRSQCFLTIKKVNVTYRSQCFFHFLPFRKSLLSTSFLFRLFTLGLSAHIVHCDKYFASASSSISLRPQYTQTFGYLSIEKYGISISAWQSKFSRTNISVFSLTSFKSLPQTYCNPSRSRFNAVSSPRFTFLNAYIRRGFSHSLHTMTSFTFFDICAVARNGIAVG